jgi:hypothetical protein
VLEDWTPPFPGLRLYYPRHRHMTAGLRAFIDLLREEGKVAGKGREEGKPATPSAAKRSAKAASPSKKTGTAKR